MMYRIQINHLGASVIEIELDDLIAPLTVKAIMDSLPFSCTIHAWGDELYTDPISVNVGAENSKNVVDLLDVAYWPPGKSICLFFGPTPVSKSDKIMPYSNVNVVGKILANNKKIVQDLDGKQVIFCYH